MSAAEGFAVKEVADWQSPNQILRSFPPLQASKIRAIAISFIPRIPDDLYDRLVQHAK
jgi:cell cycle arrest protein BUB2